MHASWPKAEADGGAPVTEDGTGHVAIGVSGHVVVDEAQDVTPMQWRVLARRVSGSSLTLLGDLAQGSSPWSPRSWADVLGRLGRAPDEATVVELAIGYRTSAEILKVALRPSTQAKGAAGRAVGARAASSGRRRGLAVLAEVVAGALAVGLAR